MQLENLSWVEVEQYLKSRMYSLTVGSNQRLGWLRGITVEVASKPQIGFKDKTKNSNCVPANPPTVRCRLEGSVGFRDKKTLIEWLLDQGMVAGVNRVISCTRCF